MSQAAVEELIDLWVNDDAFREELRTNCEGAIRSRGYELDEDEWSAVRSIDWDRSDQELQERVSKSGIAPRAATE